MKNINYQIRLGVVLTIMLLKSLTSISQSPPPPDYSFTSPVLVSGTLNALGSVYRFSNVKTGVDALVTISSLVNASVSILDQTPGGGGGWDAAFQPAVTVIKLTTGYAEFNINFVIAGTSTLVTQPSIYVTALDVDGYNYAANQKLYEFEQFDMGSGSSGYYYFGGSDLSFSFVGTGIRGTNIGGLDYGSINLSQNVRFTAAKSSVSNLKVRSGAINQDQFNDVTRQRSFYFALFSYTNTGVLATGDLKNFSGKIKDNAVQLNWELAANHNLSKVAVERSVDNRTFEKIDEVSAVGQKNLYAIDKAAGKGNNYYRLCLYESNGKCSYSNVIKLVMETDNNTSFVIYPSVVSSKATLRINSENASNGTLILADYSGKVFLRKPIDIASGNNNIDLPEVAMFQPGSYIATLYKGTETITGKIIVGGR